MLAAQLAATSGLQGVASSSLTLDPTGFSCHGSGSVTGSSVHAWKYISLHQHTFIVSHPLQSQLHWAFRQPPVLLYHWSKMQREHPRYVHSWRFTDFQYASTNSPRGSSWKRSWKSTHEVSPLGYHSQLDNTSISNISGLTRKLVLAHRYHSDLCKNTPSASCKCIVHIITFYLTNLACCHQPSCNQSKYVKLVTLWVWHTHLIHCILKYIHVIHSPMTWPAWPTLSGKGYSSSLRIKLINVCQVFFSYELVLICYSCGGF